MLSFQRLGTEGWGRLGNQLFQYAFLRVTARRLQVSFYCPPWIGDQVFHLDDATERAARPEGITRRYVEPVPNVGFNASALAIEDGTDIGGCFQSERYFTDPAVVRGWYRFKDDSVAAVRSKYRNVDFANSVGIHLRFGDYVGDITYVIAPPWYYREALARVRYKDTVVVFSDEIDRAREWVKGLPGRLIFAEGNRPHEDLYLMTQCHDFVCSVSTLSWWGAWLISHPDKTVVAPREWLRPGYHIKCADLHSSNWIEIRTCRTLLDDYRTLRFLRRAKWELGKPQRLVARLLGRRVG